MERAVALRMQSLLGAGPCDSLNREEPAALTLGTVNQQRERNSVDSRSFIREAVLAGAIKLDGTMSWPSTSRRRYPSA